MNIIVGITGASGSILAKRLLECLSGMDGKIHVIITENGRRVFRYETGTEFAAFLSAQGQGRAGIVEHGVTDLFAPVASGSYDADGMVIVPCSMSTAGKIATVCGDSLLTRAAYVCLKEKTRLVIVPRETPLHSAHLKNLLTLSEMGAQIVPPVPMFYSKAGSVDGMVDGIVGRILKSCGIPNDLYEKWGNENENNETIGGTFSDGRVDLTDSLFRRDEAGAGCGNHARL